MKRASLLVISPPCLEAVNRAVYRRLANHHGIDVHLVIPRHMRLGPGTKSCAPVADEPFKVTLLEPLGHHARLQTLKGLSHLIRGDQPTHILVDADPASLLVFDVVRTVGGTAARVWAMTAENLPRSFLREGLDGLAHGRPGAAVAGFVAGWLSYRCRPDLDHVFTLSQDGTRAMSRLGFEGRVSQIPLGFDSALFHPQSASQVAATRRRLGLESRTVAYFGRLVPEKGVDLLLQALARLKDLRWQFLIDEFSTYRTPYVDHLRKAIESLGLRDRVVYFDAPHHEMPNYMNAADVVVLPSISIPKWKEQYGRVLPEAMACGKLVIGSSSGAIPELIADGGFLFPEGNVTALAERLRYTLTAPESALSALCLKAQHRAHTLLSIDRQADIWAGMLQDGEMAVAA